MLICTMTLTLGQQLGFFITSAGSGNGANLGGLAGADAICTRLATAANSTGWVWRAYLSTTTVNARDRIGNGPWYNAKGVLIATNVENLHANNGSSALSKNNSLTESGLIVKGRGDTPNTHDILTGSLPNGTFSFNATCLDWTTNSSGERAALGHHDRDGLGANPTSWNAAHFSSGCSQANLVSTGGSGLFYCFAAERVISNDTTTTAPTPSPSNSTDKAAAWALVPGISLLVASLAW